MNLKEYFKELQRRHVVKAGIAYLVVSWLLVQVLSILVPAFGLGPGWMKTAIIILTVGFPIWLIIAWVYDFSSEGIKRTEDVPYNPEVSAKKNLSLNRFIIGGLSIAVILLVVNTLRMSDEMEEMEDQYLSMKFTNSLAIMPFRDLSPKQDQTYFSDGLARSIYDRLARSKDLKLISPTSSFQYRDKDVSIEVIAQELGVRYMLEGSVQLFDDRYRASINLVDSRDGSTIWSKTFDDTLEDVLSTYDEVALNVGEYLKVTISSEDVRKRQVDPEAYLLYLRAIDTIRSWNKEGSLAADSLIRKSIKIDPTYALSQAALSMTTLHKGLYFEEIEFNAALEIGLRSAQKAIELDPDHYWGYNWLSNWQWHAKKGQASNQTLERALELSPNNADVLFYAAFQAARQNRLEESIAYSERSVILDPKSPEPYDWIMLPNFVMGDLDRAEWALFESYEKDDPYFNGDAGYLFYLKKEFDKALKYSEEQSIDHSRLLNQSLIYLELRNIIKADSTIRILESLPNSEDYNFNTSFQLSVAYAHRNDKDRAFEYLEKAEDYVKIALEYFFTIPEFKNLYNDPRWDAYIDRLSEEFNYDFPHQPE